METRKETQPAQPLTDRLAGWLIIAAVATVLFVAAAAFGALLGESGADDTWEPEHPAYIEPTNSPEGNAPPQDEGAVPLPPEVWQPILTSQPIVICPWDDPDYYLERYRMLPIPNVNQRRFDCLQEHYWSKLVPAPSDNVICRNYSSGYVPLPEPTPWGTPPWDTWER